MISSINHYWVEGKCEQFFVISSPLLGKPEIVDLTELNVNQVRKKTIKLSGNKKNVWINIVFDTDVLKNTPAKLECFLNNISYLLKQGFNLRLLQQDNDFEDEIIKSNNLNYQKFLNLFEVRNKKEFKSNMLSENSMYEKFCKKIKSFTLWESNLIIQLSKYDNK